MNPDSSGCHGRFKRVDEYLRIDTRQHDWSAANKAQLEQESLLRKELVMLGWALTFFIVAIIAAIFGFGGIAAGAASIAKILFFIFIVLFLLSLIAGLVRGKGPTVKV